jgi:hypothetical protein
MIILVFMVLTLSVRPLWCDPVGAGNPVMLLTWSFSWARAGEFGIWLRRSHALRHIDTIFCIAPSSCVRGARISASLGAIGPGEQGKPAEHTQHREVSSSDTSSASRSAGSALGGCGQGSEQFEEAGSVVDVDWHAGQSIGQEQDRA